MNESKLKTLLEFSNGSGFKMNDLQLKILFELLEVDEEKFLKELNSFALVLHEKKLADLNDSEIKLYQFLIKQGRKYAIQVVVKSDAKPEMLEQLLTEQAIQAYLKSCNSVLQIKTNFQN